MLAARKASALPVIVAYNLPGRDACGKFSADRGPYRGGIPELGQSGLAGAIGTGAAIVVVEPDGLADIVRGCLSAAQGAERYRLLRYAMRQLPAPRRPPGCTWMSCNPGVFSDPARLGGAAAAGRGAARAAAQFSANVANFKLDGGGGALEPAAGACAGRAGSGQLLIPAVTAAATPIPASDQPQWCNPPGRALVASAPAGSRARPGSMPICGSRIPVPATGPATAARPPGSTGPSTRRPWCRQVTSTEVTSTEVTSTEVTSTEVTSTEVTSTEALRQRARPRRSGYGIWAGWLAAGAWSWLMASAGHAAALRALTARSNNQMAMGARQTVRMTAVQTIMTG